MTCFFTPFHEPWLRAYCVQGSAPAADGGTSRLFLSHRYIPSAGQSRGKNNKHRCLLSESATFQEPGGGGVWGKQVSLTWRKLTEVEPGPPKRTLHSGQAAVQSLRPRAETQTHHPHNLGCLIYTNFILPRAYCFHWKLLEVTLLWRSPMRTEINTLQHIEHCPQQAVPPKCSKNVCRGRGGKQLFKGCVSLALLAREKTQIYVLVSS